MAAMGKHIQASLSCKEEKWRVEEKTFSLPVDVGREQLQALVRQLIGDAASTLTFDFLVNGVLLTQHLEAHIASEQLDTESVISVEYVVRAAPPTLDWEGVASDWVSALHTSGSNIASGDYNCCVSIWTLEGGLVTASGCHDNYHQGPIKSVCWVDGSRLLSASADGRVNLWSFDSDTLSLLARCKGHSRSVEAVAVSPDGQKFASGSWDSYVKVWSTDHTTQPTSDEPGSPKRRHGNEVESRAPVLTLRGHGGAVTCLAWGRGGLATGGWDNCLRLWDPGTGENSNTLTSSKAFLALALSQHNGMVASGNSDKVVRLWDLRNKGPAMIQASLSSHHAWVVGVNWNPTNENQLLSGSHDSTVRLWDIRSAKLPLYTMTAHEGKVLATDWSLGRLAVTGGEDCKLRTFNITNTS